MLKLVGHGSKLRCVQTPRAAKAELSRISHRGPHVDETKKKKKKKNVLFGEDVYFRLGVEEFRTSSSSSCGACCTTI